MKKATLLFVMVAIANSIEANAGPIDPAFSIDPASSSINGNLTPDDVLTTGPLIAIQGRDLGLQDNVFGGAFDNLADFSFGGDPIQGPLYFSVDRVSIGLPGTAVFAEAQPSVAAAAGDIFQALPPVGSNRLFINETQLGLQSGFFGDDLDGLELDTEPLPNVYFTIDRLSATNGSGAGDLASNILVSAGNGRFSVYAPNTMMGLQPAAAIDGLVLWDQNRDRIAEPGVDGALFSLDPFSPDTFLFTGLNYIPCAPGHLSPADICYTDFTGAYSLWASASAIGLRPDDNVDALDTIPEPGSLVLLSSGWMGLWFWKRRRYGYRISEKAASKISENRQSLRKPTALLSERFSYLLILLLILSLPLASLAQDEFTDSQVFFGTSSSIANSNGRLFLEADLTNQHIFGWTSSDSILGDINTGVVQATNWFYYPSTPARLVFTGSGDGATFHGDILVAPYNRGVMDITRGSLRVRYLISSPCRPDEDPYQCDLRIWACALQGASASPSACPFPSLFTGAELVCPPDDESCPLTHGQVQDSSNALAFRVPDDFNPDIRQDIARLIDDNFRHAIDQVQCAGDLFIPYFSGIQAFNDSAKNARSRLGGDAPTADLYLQHAIQGAARNSWALLSYYNRWSDAMVGRFGGDAAKNPSLVYGIPNQRQNPIKLLYRVNRATERFATRTQGKDTADGPAQGNVTEWGDQLETRMLGIWASLPAQRFIAHDVSAYDTDDEETNTRDKADFGTFFVNVVDNKAWKEFMYQAAFEVATAFKCGKRAFAHSGGGVVIGFIMRLLDADQGMQQRIRQWSVGMPGGGAFVVIGLEAVLSQEVVALLNSLPSFKINAQRGRAVVQNYVAATRLGIRRPEGSPTWENPIAREIISVRQSPLVTATVAWGPLENIKGLPDIQSIGDVFLHGRIGFYVLINGGLPRVMLPEPLGR